MPAGNHAPIIASASQPLRRQPGRSLRWLAHRTSGTTATAVLENELPPGGFVPAHSHDVEELLLCRAGHGTVSIDGATHGFDHGDTAVIPPGCIHGFRNTGTTGMHVLAFFPSANPGVRWIDSRYATGWSDTADRGGKP